MLYLRGMQEAWNADSLAEMKVLTCLLFKKPTQIKLQRQLQPLFISSQWVQNLHLLVVELDFNLSFARIGKKERFTL